MTTEPLYYVVHTVNGDRLTRMSLAAPLTFQPKQWGYSFPKAIAEKLARDFAPNTTIEPATPRPHAFSRAFAFPQPVLDALDAGRLLDDSNGNDTMPHVVLFGLDPSPELFCDAIDPEDSEYPNREGRYVVWQAGVEDLDVVPAPLYIGDDIQLALRALYAAASTTCDHSGSVDPYQKVCTVCQTVLPALDPDEHPLDCACEGCQLDATMTSRRSYDAACEERSYGEDTDAQRPAPCDDCERSYGPHYRGCTHG